jgi:hypothetical protein
VVFAGDPIDEGSTMKAPIPADFLRWNFAELEKFLNARSLANAKGRSCDEAINSR